MNLQDFLSFMSPETLKTMLGDVAQGKDDPVWKQAREVIWNRMREMDDGEKLAFMFYVPPAPRSDVYESTDLGDNPFLELSKRDEETE